MAKKYHCWLVFIFFTFNAFSQRDRVHLDLSVYSCHAGDSIYFRGVVRKGSHPSNSTNLYVSLYSEAGIRVQHMIFPIAYGESAGQVVIADSLKTGNYFLVALTRQQVPYDSTDFFSVPILVYNHDKPAPGVVRQRPILYPANATGSIVKGISWATTPYKGKLSSLVEIDSTDDHPRHLRLLKLINADSGMIINVTLDNRERQKYCIFPLTPGHDNEIFLLYEDSTLIGRQFIHLKDAPPELTLHTDTLDNAPYAANSWHFDLPKGSYPWHTSIDVTDADRTIPSPATIDRLEDSYTDDFSVADTAADTAFISFTGTATRESGRSIRDPFSQQVVVAGVHDSSFLFTRVIDIDKSGHFKLDSLIVFGSVDLRFQINKAEDGGTKDVRLRLAGYTPPRADSTVWLHRWEDDTLAIAAADTAYTPNELSKHDLAHLQTLQTVIVKGWKNPREELDQTYTSGPFSEPALYVYDLRNDSSEYNRDIYWYINEQNGRLHYDPKKGEFADVLEHPIHYFIDEQEYTCSALRIIDFDRIAYIKILESDFLSTQRVSFDLQSVKNGKSTGPLSIPDQKTALNVCIYTRKGKDFRTMRGGLNKITITGYEKTRPFHPNPVTLFWDTEQRGQSFHVRFSNNGTTRRFRLKVEAINAAGQVVHFEKIIGPDEAPAKYATGR